MKYQEAMGYIDSCATYGIVPGLESIKELLRRLGNPEKNSKVIHIAGTNGKGSTLAFISTALTENGYKVGRYVSPTIVEYRERFQIQGKPISKAEVAKLMEQVAPHADTMEQEGLPHPTPFEIETAMAFLLFQEKKCDFVVLETGMGGLLDATNVVDKTLISVLTSIDNDHSAFLGDSLQEIAIQKAGIIKPGCVVISAEQDENVQSVIEQIAFKQNAIKTIFIHGNEIKNVKFSLQKTAFTYKDMKKMEISLLGSYQVKNAALALEVLYQLQNLGFSLKEEKIRKAFKETVWSARFQILDKKPVFIIDGAHNPAAARELRSSLEFYFTNKRIIYIMGMFRDKEYETVIQQTCDLAQHIITVSKKGNSRALSALELAQEVMKVNPIVTVADSVDEAVELAYLLADKDSVIVAFGSLAYLGECMEAVNKHRELRKDTHV